MLDAFDFPDTHESCSVRNRTTTAPQALTLLNGEEPAEWARAFAGRVLETAGADPSRQVEAAFQLAYSRAPSPAEKDTVITFFDRQARIIAAQLEQGGEPAVPDLAIPGVSTSEAASLVDFCLMLLNSNEFSYRF